jgi:hypothetical protein
VEAIHNGLAYLKVFEQLFEEEYPPPTKEYKLKDNTQLP